jgi:tripartite-type tricarboxylate transporter receptor subunit TctC
MRAASWGLCNLVMTQPAAAWSLQPHSPISWPDKLQVMFDSLPTSIESIRAGKLQALAVMTAARSEMLPDVPTVREFVPGYEVSSWFGIGAPASTPADIVEKLSADVGIALADPRLRTRIGDLSSVPLPLSPRELSTLIVAETEKWAKVIKFSGAKAE